MTVAQVATRRELRGIEVQLLLQSRHLDDLLATPRDVLTKAALDAFDGVKVLSADRWWKYVRRVNLTEQSAPRGLAKPVGAVCGACGSMLPLGEPCGCGRPENAGRPGP